MGITLSIFWFLVCTATILFYKKFNTFGIKKPLLVGIFLFKILIGFFYLYIHSKYYSGGDSVVSFYKSDILYRLFFTHPDYFFKLFVIRPIPAPSVIAGYADQIDFYNDKSTYFMVRLQTVLRFISGGHFIVHIVLYNFFVFWGMLYLYGFCVKIIRAHSWLLLLIIFFMPSAAFWTSGFHKDGIELCAISLLLYSVYQLLSGQGTAVTICRILLGGFLLYEVRIYVLLIVMVCLLAYSISYYFQRRFAIIYSATLLLFFIVSLLSVYFNKDYNVLYVMYYWQGMFMYLNHGNTNLLLPVLEPTLTGLLRVLPVSFENVFLHPNILECFNTFLKADFLINILHGLLLIFGVYSFIKISKDKSTIHGILLFISLGLLSALFYGIIVGNLGALSRYRSVPFLLLWLGYSISISKLIEYGSFNAKVNALLFESMHPVAS